MNFDELPVLGVGLAADVAGAMPNFRVFLESKEDTIDYLSFGAHYLQRQRIEYYIDDLIKARLPIVYHPINFNVAIADREGTAIVEGIVDIAKYVSAVWTGQDVGVWSFENQYLGSFLIPAIFDSDSVTETVEKVKHISERMPCPFLIENPPVNFSLENMHVLDFMSQVSYAADCGMVLDIGHLIGYQQATGRDADEMPVDDFPFERIVEVHVAGLQISKIGADINIIDQHSLPVHELCWEFLSKYGSKMTCLKGITLEQEFCANELVLQHLRKARRLTKELGLFSYAN